MPEAVQLVASAPYSVYSETVDGNAVIGLVNGHSGQKEPLIRLHVLGNGLIAGEYIGVNTAVFFTDEGGDLANG